MNSEEIIRNLQNVMYTLDGVRVSNREGEWDKLLGCRQVLGSVCEALREDAAPEEA